MNRRIAISVVVIVAAVSLAWLLLSPGAADEANAQGLIEYELIFGLRNAFAVNSVSFHTEPNEDESVTNVWEEAKFVDGCSQWQTFRQFGGAQTFVLARPSSESLETLGASPQTLIGLAIPPDATVMVCDRMLHALSVEVVTVLDLAAGESMP